MTTLKKLNEMQIIVRAVKRAQARCATNPLFGGHATSISIYSIMEDDEIVEQCWTDSKIQRLTREASAIGLLEKRKFAREFAYSVPR